jgi:hypothetical protein
MRTHHAPEPGLARQRPLRAVSEAYSGPGPPESQRACGICGTADIPDLDWPWWSNGKPVHPRCRGIEPLKEVIVIRGAHDDDMPDWFGVLARASECLVIWLGPTDELEAFDEDQMRHFGWVKAT